MASRASRIFNIAESTTAVSNPSNPVPAFEDSNMSTKSSRASDKASVSPAKSQSPSPKATTASSARRQKQLHKTVPLSTQRQSRPDFSEAAKIYDFEDDDQDVNVMQSLLSSSMSASTFRATPTCEGNSPANGGVKSSKYVKPKQRWMRQEDLQRYQEVRQKNQLKLRELETTGSTAQYVPFPEAVTSVPATEQTSKSTPTTTSTKTKAALSKSTPKVMSENRKRPKPPEEPSVKTQKKQPPAKKSKSSVASPVKSGALATPKTPAKKSNSKAANKSEAQEPEITDAVSPKEDNSDESGPHKVGDIVWAKLAGYPPWPCRVENVAKSSGSTEKEATVVWFKWDSLKSVFPVSRLMSFEAHFPEKFEPKRKGNYRLAVEEAVDVCSKGKATLEDWLPRAKTSSPAKSKVKSSPTVAKMSVPGQ